MQSKGRSLTGEAPSAVDQLRHDASKTTEAAVAEGERDVEAAKSAGAGLVDQAKGLIGNAISTGQVNLHVLNRGFLLTSMSVLPAFDFGRRAGTKGRNGFQPRYHNPNRRACLFNPKRRCDDGWNNQGILGRGSEDR